LTIFGALGLAVLIVWLLFIVLVAGLLTRRLRGRSFRRGTHPLRLLPWYLGGPPRADADLPDDRRSSRDRSRHP
jgi:hypothetical protein